MARLVFKVFVIAGILSCSIVFATEYHQPDLFPIGFSGFSYVGYTKWELPYNEDGSPYYDTAAYGTWVMEESLLVRTHCNFIGCSDAWYNSYIAFTSPDKRDFYNKVCIPALQGGDTIYVGVNGVRLTKRWDGNENGYIYTIENGDTISDLVYDTTYKDTNNDDIKDTIVTEIPEYGFTPSVRRWSSVFRNWGPPSFGTCTSCPGDEFWQAMTKEGAECYDDYFDNNSGVNTHCFWGYNPFVENPAIFRGGLGSDRSLRRPGVYAADDSIAKWIRARETSGSGGLHGSHRMIIGKHQLYPLMQQESGVEVNLFEKVPEIDAVLVYTLMWDSWTPYGRQSHFDRMIYSVYDNNPKGGFHNAATYMQNYGKTPPLRAGQDRRWMAGIEINWEFIWENNTEKVMSRRPCPPEIRAMTYLALSRGAKGIVYVNYYNNRWRNVTIPNAFPTSSNFPAVDSGYGGSHTARTGCLGLRDYTSQPCDDNYSGGTPMLLDVDDGQTTYWDTMPDYTFGYICELIPEIKKITSTLMELDWVNAYTLKSTVSGKSSPCPHMYVKDITTNREGYIDLAFFTHPQDQASNYFMIVNRDDIDSMRNANIKVVLYYQGYSKVVLTDMADMSNVTVLSLDSAGYFSFTRSFAPGEGKLFRARPDTVAFDPYLQLMGEWRGAKGGDEYMSVLHNTDVWPPPYGFAYLTWIWLRDKPERLDSMWLWQTYTGHDWQKTWPRHLPPISKKASFIKSMLDSCMTFCEVGYHVDGDTLIPSRFGVGTQSRNVTICYAEYPGCPDLYSFFLRDTVDTTKHVFIENNTILPHSQHYQTIDEDLLKLDVLNTEPDHYYLSIVENDDEISYLDQVKLWVVDHDAEEQVATSADDSIYVYSDLVGPASCTDQGNNDRLDQILWEDTASFAGPTGSYLTVKFDDPGWSNAGLLMSLGVHGEAAFPPKDYLSIPSEPGGGGTWDSLGVAYGRMNPSQWLVDVSDCDSFTFRVYCYGDDTCFIDRIALVKLEPSGWSLTEAVLDSAVLHDPPAGSETVTLQLTLTDTFHITLESGNQVSLRFDQVDTSATYPVRDFVFQSRGYYISPPSMLRSAIEEKPLQFGMKVEQITPLSRAAYISYSVPYAINVKIGVYDVAGRLVKSIVNEKVKPGKYSEQWQGKDNAGRTLASGVYFVKMMTEDFEETDKIVILE